MPAVRVGEDLVTTVFDLMLATYGVGRDGLPGEWPASYDDPSVPYTPAWQERITGVPAGGDPGRAGVRPQRRAQPRPVDDRHGRGRQPVVPFGQTYRAMLALVISAGCQGVNGGGWAHYVGQEKVRPLTGWPPRLRVRLATAHAAQGRDAAVVSAHGPVALRGVPAGELASPPVAAAGRETFADYHALPPADGLVAGPPHFDRNPLDLADQAAAAGHESASTSSRSSRAGRLHTAAEDPDDPANLPRCLTVWRANLFASSGRATST